MTTTRKDQFNALYHSDPDPWAFETSAYEKEKYAATLEALPRDRYASAIEIGCSIGVLSELIAQRCDRFLGVDVSSVALAQARARLAPIEQAMFLEAEIPGQWPPGRYDLIVLSEILYFLGEDEIFELANHVKSDLTPGGHCVLVNWLGATDTDLSGGQAAGLFCAHATHQGALSLVEQVQQPSFGIQVLEAGRLR